MRFEFINYKDLILKLMKKTFNASLKAKSSAGVFYSFSAGVFYSFSDLIREF